MKKEDNLGLGPSTDIDEEMSDIEQVAGWLYRHEMPNAAQVLRGEIDARNARIASLAYEVVQVRAEFAEGQGEYEMLDRLLQAKELDADARIAELNAEVERYMEAMSEVKVLAEHQTMEFEEIVGSIEIIARKALKESENCGCSGEIHYHCKKR